MPTLQPIDWITLVLVAVTAFYAWATFRILRANEAVVEQMRRQTEAQLRPYVVAAPHVRVGASLLSLRIENTGRSAALDLRLRIDKDFYFNGEHRDQANIAKLPAFTEPIASFAPSAQLLFTLGAGHTIFGNEKDLCPTLFRVCASYTSAGRHYEEEHVVDLRPMLSSAVPQDPVATELERLRQSLEKSLKGHQ